MKFLEKLLSVTVLFCLLPLTASYALSEEAQQAIEAIRTKLNRSNFSFSFSNANANTDDTYVAGRELSKALSKVKQNRIKSEIKNQKRIVSTADSKNENNETNNQTNEVININNESVIQQDSSSIDSQKDTNKPIETDNKTFNNTKESENQLLEKLSSMSDDNDSEIGRKEEYHAGSLLERSIMRIRKSRRSTSPASDELDEAIEQYEKRLEEKNYKNSLQNSKEVMQKANEEIEELFSNPDKRAHIAEQERNRRNIQKNNYNPNVNDSTSNNEVINDETFNDYLSHYNFKMPENYRIIIE